MRASFRRARRLKAGGAIDLAIQRCELGQGASSGVQPPPRRARKFGKVAGRSELASATRRRANGLDPACRTSSPEARLHPAMEWAPTFVDVTDDGFVFDGKTYRSLSADRTADHRHALVGAEVLRPVNTRFTLLSLRGLHPQIHRRGSRAGFQLARCPARSLCRLYCLASRPRLEAGLRSL